jgi:hypothetical protein
MLGAHMGEGAMKRLLVAALTGLLCVGASREGFAAATSTAPSQSAPTTPLSRDQYLPKLREFYARGKALYDQSRSDKLSDQDVDLQFNAFLKWANDAGSWMNGAIFPAATTQFTTWHAEFGVARKLAGSHPQAADNKFSTLNIVLPQLLENLRIMMMPLAADSQKATTDGSK